MRSSINWLDSWQETNLRWSLTIGPRVDGCWLSLLHAISFYHFQVVVATANPPGLVSMMRSLQTYHRLLSRQGGLVLVAPRTADISCQANNKCQKMSRSPDVKQIHLRVVFMLFGTAKIGSGVGRISSVFGTSAKFSQWWRNPCPGLQHNWFLQNGYRYLCLTWCLCTFTDPKENWISRIWNHTLSSLIACCFFHQNIPIIPKSTLKSIQSMFWWVFHPVFSMDFSKV